MCLRGAMLAGVGGLIVAVCAGKALPAGEARFPEADAVIRKGGAQREAVVKQADRLIVQLSDDDPAVRETATQALNELYPQAVLHIERVAAAATDPERKMRLKRITTQPHEGLVVCRFGKSLPENLTMAKLAGLTAVAAPEADITCAPDLRLLVIAGKNRKRLQAGVALLRFLGVEAMVLCVPGKPDLPKAERKTALHQKLSKRISFEFGDLPLRDAVTFFRRSAEINIFFDPTAEKKGLKPVNLRVTDQDLMTALTLLCKESDLTFEIRENAVFITQFKRCYEMDEGFAAFYLHQGAPDGPTVAKVKELSSVFEARSAYDPELKVLGIACNRQESFERITSLLHNLSGNSRTDKELRVLVVFDDGQAGSRRAEALLRALAERTGKGP